MKTESGEPPPLPDAFGYCTNVHAGATLEELAGSLQRFAVSVRDHLQIRSPLPVGLWVSARATTELHEQDACRRFRDFLQQHQLLPYTLNGFPYGDFHQRVVKHAVYQPDWLQQERQAYTLALVELLDQLLPRGVYGSISTLPIAWGSPPLSEPAWQLAAESLACVARRLDELEQRSGRRICLCLEPEPGCGLQYSTDVVRFFERFLDRCEQPERVRRYVGVCHDVCHADVMFESQTEVITRYRRAGIHVGKVQVSSSVRARFKPDEPPQDTAQRMESLKRFAEDRYLHQTSIRRHDGTSVAHEDLPAAIGGASQQHQLMGSEWRVHFHVPIYAATLGSLGTGQQAIGDCLDVIQPATETHFEVETYAWNVLPPELQQADLSAGIARELQWLREALAGGGE